MVSMCEVVGSCLCDADSPIERRAPSAERRAPSAERRAPSAERRAPSAERMTASRARGKADPPSPPDRLPPRRGGRSSPYIYAASGAGRPAGFARRSARAVTLAATTAGPGRSPRLRARERSFLGPGNSRPFSPATSSRTPPRAGLRAMLRSPERLAEGDRAEPGQDFPRRRRVAAAAALVLLAPLLLLAGPQSAHADTEIWNATPTLGACADDSGSPRGFDP